MPDAEANGSSTPEEGAPQSAEVVAAGGSGTPITSPARYGFAPEQVAAIKRTVASDCNDHELVLFLETCARHNLDPFIGQIYAAKIKSRIAIIVSRDGLLAKAHKEPDFEGLIGDVVHADDTFAVSYVDGKRAVRHEYGIGPEKGRGEIIGAWAEVRRKNFEPTFFFAPLSEYKRGGETPWAKQTSAMILKVAEAYALRKAFSVSGVVGEEEISRDRTDLTALPEEPAYGEDALGARLRDLVAEANDLVPGSYRPAKVRTLLDGADQERREAFANELADFIADHTEQVEAEIAEAVTVEEPALAD